MLRLDTELPGVYSPQAGIAQKVVEKSLVGRLEKQLFNGNS